MGKMERFRNPGVHFLLTRKKVNDLWKISINKGSGKLIKLRTTAGLVLIGKTLPVFAGQVKGLEMIGIKGG